MTSKLRNIIYSFSAILILLYSGWFYLLNFVADTINNDYPNKELSINNSYTAKFSQVKPNYHPLRISWSVVDFFEESSTSKSNYLSPIKFGYNILTQKIFIEYNGDIKSLHKNGLKDSGVLLKVHNSKLEVDLDLDLRLVECLVHLNNYAEIFNILGALHFSHNKFEAFDLLTNKKFYTKELEYLKFTFSPHKKYTSLNDILSNIPQYYKIYYNIKSTTNNTAIHPIGTGLFQFIPATLDITSENTITTEANNILGMQSNFALKSYITFKSSVVDITKLRVIYTLIHDKYNMPHHDTNITSNFKIKQGFFNRVFEQYKIFGSQLFNISNEKVEREIAYVIDHKQDFAFNALENIDYELTLNMNSYFNQDNSSNIVHNIKIANANSNIKIVNNQQIGDVGKSFKGSVRLTNSYDVIKFTSGYAYRFGKLSSLDIDLKKLYIDTNRAFLYIISPDDNQDTSPNRSNKIKFSYFIDPANRNISYIGSVRLNKIHNVYSSILYQKLVNQIGSNVDVLHKVLNIIPNTDIKNPLLDNVLLRIQKLQDNSSTKQLMHSIKPSTQNQDVFIKSVKKKAIEFLPKNGAVKNILDTLLPKSK